MRIISQHHKSFNYISYAASALFFVFLSCSDKKPTESVNDTSVSLINYPTWKDASAPFFIKNMDTYGPIPDTNGRDYIPSSEVLNSSGISSDVSKMEYKAKACWFNVIPSDVNFSTIWGSSNSFVSGDGQVTSLDFYFHPEMRGEFNYSMNLQQTIGLDNPDPASHVKSWAGIQRVLGRISTNLVDQKVSFIDLWINIVQQQKPENDSAKLYIDIGSISEDVIPNKTLNTEDGLDNPLHIPRGIINANYDWGLDTMNNAMEQKYYESFWKHYPNHPEYESDPSADDWERFPIGTAHMLDMALAEQYEGVNGTEGNFVSEEGRFPDTEDLNRNGKVDRMNSYFEYEIPLDTVNIRFKQMVRGIGYNHWFQIHIPLTQYERRIGQPTFTSVEGVRLWVTGAGKPLLFRIVDFNLVDNE